MKDNEKIFEKIRKLVAKKDSAEDIGNIHEAEAFAVKISELLTKYNLSMMDVGEEKEKTDIKDKFFGDIKNPKNEGKWIYELYSTICDFNYCKMITHSSKTIRNQRLKKVETGATIFGTPENVEIVKFLSEQLEAKIRFLSKKAWKIAKQNPDEKKNSFLRAYFSGAVLGIYVKLRDMREAQEANNESVTGLVLYNQEKLENAINDKFSDVKPNRDTKSRKESIGGVMGFMDGQNVGINKGINENKPEKTIEQ